MQKNIPAGLRTDTVREGGSKPAEGCHDTYRQGNKIIYSKGERKHEKVIGKKEG